MRKNFSFEEQVPPKPLRGGINHNRKAFSSSPSKNIQFQGTNPSQPKTDSIQRGFDSDDPNTCIIILDSSRYDASFELLGRWIR